MSYDKLKQEIKEISEIAASVPDAFREKCFEVLLSHVLSGEKSKVPLPAGDDNEDKPDNSPDLKLQSHVMAFIRRHEISQEQIEALVMVEGDDFHFLKQPSHKKASRGQKEWALLLALKNGILNNSLKADPEDIRSLVQDKGYYDSPNFASNFKQAKFAACFKGPLERQGQAQALSQEGEKALAELINSLTN